MRSVLKCLGLWSLLATVCHVAGKPATLNPQKKTIVSTAVDKVIGYLAGKVTKESVGSATKSFASAVAKYYSTKSEASLAIGINNNLNGRDLVDPRLYLEEGDVVGPAPLIIKAIADENQRQTKVVLLDGKKIKGILCYHRVTEENANFLVCVYFDREQRMFTVTIEYVTGTVNEKDLETRFTTMPKMSSLVDAKTINNFVMFHTPKTNDPKLDSEMEIFAQMTTGSSTRLVLDVFDTRQMFNFKREPISAVILTGLIAAAPSVLFTAATSAYKYLKAEKATILTLDNLSTSKESLILLNPIWITAHVKTENIIPGILGPRQSTDITFTTSSFTSTSFSLVSYQIGDSNYRIVIANWWPLKVVKVTQSHNRYSVFRLLANDGESARDNLQKFANAIQEHPKEEEKAKNAFDNTLQDPWTFIKNEKYQSYRYWRLPINNALGSNPRYLKVLTAMGSGGKNALVVKVFVETVEPGTQFQNTFVGPEEFVYTAEEVPPEYF